MICDADARSTPGQDRPGQLVGGSDSFVRHGPDKLNSNTAVSGMHGMKQVMSAQRVHFAPTRLVVSVKAQVRGGNGV